MQTQAVNSAAIQSVPVVRSEAELLSLVARDGTMADIVRVASGRPDLRPALEAGLAEAGRGLTLAQAQEADVFPAEARGATESTVTRLSRADLQAIYDDPNRSLSDVLPPGIYSVDFPIEAGDMNLAGGIEHRHFVQVREGRPDRILTGYNDADGQLKVEISGYRSSIHNPINQLGDDDPHTFRPVDLGGRDPDAVWTKMTAAARAINGADLNYHVTSQNSNSANSTLADAGGVDTDTTGIAPGSGNLLWDEIEGGRQSPPFGMGSGSVGGSSGSPGASSGGSSASSDASSGSSRGSSGD